MIDRKRTKIEKNLSSANVSVVIVLVLTVIFGFFALSQEANGKPKTFDSYTQSALFANGEVIQPKRTILHDAYITSDGQLVGMDDNGHQFNVVSGYSDVSSLKIPKDKIVVIWAIDTQDENAYIGDTQFKTFKHDYMKYVNSSNYKFWRTVLTSVVLPVVVVLVVLCFVINSVRFIAESMYDKEYLYKRNK